MMILDRHNGYEDLVSSWAIWGRHISNPTCQPRGRHCDNFDMVITKISPVHLEDLHGPSPVIQTNFSGPLPFLIELLSDFYLFLLGFCLYKAHFIYGPWPFYCLFHLFHPLFFSFFSNYFWYYLVGLGLFRAHIASGPVKF
jgi:hypothetical protein